MSVVVLYTRPGCHLCDEARDVILSLRDSTDPFALREIDIESDADLHARFLERIPVVEIDGELVAELHVDAPTLRRVLPRARSGTVRSMTDDPVQEPR